MNVTNVQPGVLGPDDGQYTQQYRELIATNYFGLASFVVLLYDHVLTFDDEVRYVWRGNKKLVTWLFFINRYLTPLGFAVNINAYLSRVWTPVICANFVRYEGAMTLIGISVASLMMGVRVTAIYRGNRMVLSLISLMFLGMVGVNAWLLTSGQPVHHPIGIHGCSMIFGPQIGGWASASAWLPLLYDTVVVALVVLRTRDIVRVKVSGQYHVVNTLIKDGLLYYSVILAANLVLALMISKSSDGVKNICAQFQLLITVTMMSRITLNLRKNMQRLETPSLSSPVRPSSGRSSLAFQGPRSSTQTIPNSTFKSGRMKTEDLEASVLDIPYSSSPREQTRHSREIMDWRDES